MHRTRLAREQQLRWDEEKGPEMTTTITTITAIVAITTITAIVAIVWGKKPPEITVTYLILGGLFPREVEMRFRDAPDKLIASKAPERAFAFKRSDSFKNMVYIDGEVLAVEDLVEEGLGDIARATIADGARSAVRLKGTNMWCPFFRTDSVVMTDR